MKTSPIQNYINYDILKPNTNQISIILEDNTYRRSLLLIYPRFRALIPRQTQSSSQNYPLENMRSHHLHVKRNLDAEYILPFTT